MISIDDFKKIEISAGKILSAEKVPATDKLLKLSVDFGESVPRQIISGIAGTFTEPEKLAGLTCVFVTNLEPRTIKGLESQGMILALSDPDGLIALLTPTRDIPAGTKAK